MHSKNIIRALHYAARQHSPQRRKDEAQSPYINHPITLLHILHIEAGIDDEDVLIAALLHDVMEDCSGPHQMFIEDRRREIREQFGDTVLGYVEAVTDDKTVDKNSRKRAQVEKAAKKPHGAKLVKIADKIANLRDIKSAPPANWNEERKTEYVRWAREVVGQLRGSHEKLEMLFDEVAS